MERFSFEHEGEEFEISPENTFGFVHQHPEDEQFDHIFFMTGQNEDGYPEGRVMWRDKCDDFEAAIEQLDELEFVIFHPERVTDEDRAEYFKTHPAELKVVDLTVRQERRVKFLEYLLINERLMVEDFQPAGELFI